MSQVRNNTVKSIQILRWFAAWIVVFHHFGRELGSPVAGFFAQNGNFGVDVFFVISGFIMFHVGQGRDETPKQFLLNRLFRLVPTYWLGTLLIVLMKVVYPAEFAYTDWTPSTLLASLFFIPVENPAGLGPFPVLCVGWTLNIEIFFYLLLGACSLLGRRTRFVVCSLVLLAAPIVWHREWPDGAVLGSRKLYEFVLGIMIAAWYVNRQALASLLASRPSLSAVAWFERNLAWFSFAPAIVCLVLDRDGMRLLAAGLIVVSALGVEARLSASNPVVRALVRLGEMSYSTYVFHVLVIGAMVHALGPPTSLVREALEWGLLTVLVIAASYVGYTFVETNPIFNRLKRRCLSLGASTATKVANEAADVGVQSRPVALRG